MRKTGITVTGLPKLHLSETEEDMFQESEKFITAAENSFLYMVTVSVKCMEACFHHRKINK